jgi:molecular chaperone HscB
LHPDRFASRTATERAASLAQATALNEAYQTLRDPLSRAAYLLQLAGIEAPTEASGTVNDPELLMESLDRREALAQAGSPEEILKIAGEADADAKACVGALSNAFAAGDLEDAKRLTTRLKYLNKLTEEARARLSRTPC